MASALWAGPGAARALHGDGEVEVALHPGGYVRLDDGYVLVAGARAPRGPLTILVSGLEAAPLRPGDAAHVDGALYVGGHTIALGLRPASGLAAGPLRPGWRAALTAALESAPGPPQELAAGLAALRAGDVEAAVGALAGRGEGLTPAGDDVLAGYAAWRHAANLKGSDPFSHRANLKGSDPVLSRLAAGRASPIGLAYLECAERGELPDVAAGVVTAIRAGDAAAARRRARALSRWGGTSGTAILWGVASAT